MFSRAILKYNNINYKLVMLPLRGKCSNVRHKKFNSYDEKLENSISRAKKIIFELVANNDFKYFVTLTFNDTLNDYNLDIIRNHVTQLIRDLRKKYKNLTFDYVIIPEKHKKGDWHLHCFFSKDFEVDFVYNDHNYIDWVSFIKFGQCNISKIRNYEASCKYLTKYITKDLYEVAKGKHLYFCSNGLKKAQKLYDFVTAGYHNDFDFENEFCSVKEISLNDIDKECDNLCKSFYSVY